MSEARHVLEIDPVEVYRSKVCSLNVSLPGSRTAAVALKTRLSLARICHFGAFEIPLLDLLALYAV